MKKTTKTDDTMLPPEPPGFTVEGGGVVLPLHLTPAGLLQVQTGKDQSAPPRPSEGRIVRYVKPDGTFRAALVSEVPFASLESIEAPLLNIDLAVIEPRNPHLGVAEDVPFDPSGHLPHSWHWPTRI